MKVKFSSSVFLFFLILSLMLSGCGLLGMGGGDKKKEEPVADQVAEQPVSPAVSAAEDDFVTKRQFFELGKDLTTLKTELARIKSDINAYSKIPSAIREPEVGYGFLESTEITHKVTLSNGTVVYGKVTRESLDQIILITQIGTLTIDRRQISDIAPAESPKAECHITGDPGALETRVYQDRRVYTGFVKNIGERRADFVLVKIKLARENTVIVAVDSAYVDGINTKFQTGVVSDTSIKPDEVAPFSVTVYLPPDPDVAYYTAEVYWEEYD